MKRRKGTAWDLPGHSLAGTTAVVRENDRAAAPPARGKNIRRRCLTSVGKNSRAAVAREGAGAKSTDAEPLDGGALTIRWARSPARGPAAALHPSPAIVYCCSPWR
jgi:hypothetical protein